MTRIVQHYKGGRYLVLVDDAIESTNGQEGGRVVIYFSLERETWHTRSLVEFNQYVEVRGQVVPRFKTVS